MAEPMWKVGLPKLGNAPHMMSRHLPESGKSSRYVTPRYTNTNDLGNRGPRLPNRALQLGNGSSFTNRAPD